MEATRKKITIPESSEDVTLGHYIEWRKSLEEEENDTWEFELTKAAEIFCGTTQDELSRMKKKDRDLILTNIEKVLSEKPKHKKFIEVDGKKFGFHPCIEEMTVGEYIDADTHFPNPENWHKLLSVLYRPVKEGYAKSTFYEIEPYAGSSKYCDKMLEQPLSVAFGVSFFLQTILKELVKSSRQSLKKKRKTTGLLSRLKALFMTGGAGTRRYTY